MEPPRLAATEETKELCKENSIALIVKVTVLLECIAGPQGSYPRCTKPRGSPAPVDTRCTARHCNAASVLIAGEWRNATNQSNAMSAEDEI